MYRNYFYREDLQVELTQLEEVGEPEAVGEKTAQDLFYQYLDFCENHPNEKSAADFLSQM